MSSTRSSSRAGGGRRRAQGPSNTSTGTWIPSPSFVGGIQVIGLLPDGTFAECCPGRSAASRGLERAPHERLDLAFAHAQRLTPLVRPHHRVQHARLGKRAPTTVYSMNSSSAGSSSRISPPSHSLRPSSFDLRRASRVAHRSRLWALESARCWSPDARTDLSATARQGLGHVRWLSRAIRRRLGSLVRAQGRARSHDVLQPCAGEERRDHHEHDERGEE